VLVGALIIQTISSALVIKNVQPYWSTVLTGVLLLAALGAERSLTVAVANRVVERKPAPMPPLVPPPATVHPLVPPPATEGS
jgi:putative copper export protein